MSSQLDPHDPRFELERLDNIVLLALGETVDPAFDAHRATCEQCQRDLASYAETVTLGRETTEHPDVRDAQPSPVVWSRIAGELGIGRHAAPTPPAPPTPPTPIRRHRMRWRAGLLVAAVTLIALVGVGTGFLLGRNTGGTSDPSITANARLVHMPGGPADVAGKAIVHSTSKGKQLSITTDGLPLRNGYYEVWLYNPTANRMVAIGTLANDGSGSFPVPGGLDIRDYTVVDVSAQKFDGNPVHQQSVLRGPLTQ